MTTSDHPSVSFHRTRDGLLAARTGDYAFLALPAATGGLRVAEGRDPGAEPEFWTETDFCVIGHHTEDEAGFRAYVHEIARHRRQLAALGRREARMDIWTPWGWPQGSRVYAEGIVFHATASHGGFHLDDAANAAVQPAYRNADQWYEEDSQWAKVAAAFPDLFTDYERQCADRTLRNWEPDAYEAVNGVTLQPRESHTKDARQFRVDHAARWIVISAINSKQRPGFVECTATLGGERRFESARRFLVPSSEYDPGAHGFVIDENRQEAYD